MDNRPTGSDDQHPGADLESENGTQGVRLRSADRESGERRTADQPPTAAADQGELQGDQIVPDNNVDEMNEAEADRHHQRILEQVAADLEGAESPSDEEHSLGDPISRELSLPSFMDALNMPRLGPNESVVSPSDARSIGLDLNMRPFRPDRSPPDRPTRPASVPSPRPAPLSFGLNINLNLRPIGEPEPDRPPPSPSARVVRINFPVFNILPSREGAGAGVGRPSLMEGVRGIRSQYGGLVDFAANNSDDDADQADASPFSGRPQIRSIEELQRLRAGHLERVRTEYERLIAARDQSRIAMADRLAVALADNTNSCAICLDEIKQKTLIVPCFHQYCHHCLFEWFKKKTFCPVCRAEIDRILYNILSATSYSECRLPMRYNPYEDAWEDLTSQPEAALLPPNLGAEQPQLNASPNPFGIGGRDVPRLYYRSGADFNLLHNPPPQRYIRLSLIQMLSTLLEKHPTEGFPIRRLNLTTFKDALPFTVAREDLLPAYFRCFIYLHNYRPVANWNNTRPIPVELINSQVEVRLRVDRFMRREYECLKRGIDFTGDWRQCVSNALTNADMRSEEFKKLFRNAVMVMTSLHMEVNAYDIVEKLRSELVTFAESPFADHEQFVANVTYAWQGTPEEAGTSSTSSQQPKASGTSSEAETQQPSAAGKRSAPTWTVTSAAAAEQPTASTSMASGPNPSEGQSVEASGSLGSARTSARASTSLEVINVSSSGSEVAGGGPTGEAADGDDGEEQPPKKKAKKKKKEDEEDSSSDVQWLPAEDDVSVPPAGQSPFSSSLSAALLQPLTPIEAAPEDEPQPGPSGLQPLTPIEAAPEDEPQPGPSGLQPPPPPPISSKSPLRSSKSHKRPLPDIYRSPTKQAAAPAPGQPAAAETADRLDRSRRLEIRQMRRIIRNAHKSHYFYTLLLREVQKKYLRYNTILNSPCFSHLENLFKDMHTFHKFYRERSLADLEDLKRTLAQHTNCDSDIDDAAVASSSSEGTEVQLTGYQCLSALSRRRVKFINNLYSDESD